MLEVCENDVLHRAVRMVVFAQAFWPSCPFLRCKINTIRQQKVQVFRRIVIKVKNRPVNYDRSITKLVVGSLLSLSSVALSCLALP